MLACIQNRASFWKVLRSGNARVSRVSSHIVMAKCLYRGRSSAYDITSDKRSWTWAGDSADGIATGYRRGGPGIVSLWKARFSPPVQTDGYRLVPGAKAAGVWHWQTTTDTEVIKWVELLYFSRVQFPVGSLEICKWLIPSVPLSQWQRWVPRNIRGGKVAAGAQSWQLCHPVFVECQSKNGGPKFHSHPTASWVFMTRWRNSFNPLAPEFPFKF